MSKTLFRPVFRSFLGLKTWLGPVLRTLLGLKTWLGPVLGTLLGLKTWLGPVLVSSYGPAALIYRAIVSVGALGAFAPTVLEKYHDNS